jgi:hypothetical protein
MPPSSDRQSDQTLNRRGIQTLAAAVTFLHCALALAAAPYLGRQLDEALREISSRGIELVYNSAIVPPSLKVTSEPAPGSDLEVLERLLAQHGLRADRVADGIYAVVRDESKRGAAKRLPVVAAETVPLEGVIVTASRYSLAADIPDFHTFLTQAQVEALPHLGDDSLKAIHRLPGAASNGLSGLAHMRGGEENETLIVFDGLPLHEPFHLRLMQSPISVLDQRVVDSLDVYAGGFTAEFGDRMSAIVDSRSVHPAADRYYELGLSLFHASALASQKSAGGRGQWLVSFRRSNLDVVADWLNSDLGEPKYMDGFARVDYSFSDATRGSFEALLSTDKASVSNTSGTEQVDADYRNTYLWASLEHDWSGHLRGRALLSFTDVSSERKGSVLEEGQRDGSVDDRRDYDVVGLKLDGSYDSGRWLHRFGAEVRTMRADYAYVGHILFQPDYPFPGSPQQAIDRSLAPRPSGEHYAAYATSRLRITDDLTAELGLRWDRQTYSGDSDNQPAPRLNLVWGLDDSTRLRASWGRFEQFQGIEELQVEDGVDEFQRAQRTDHAIVGLEHDLPAGFAIRAELYRKDYGQPRLRYENLFDPLSLAPELRWDRVAIAPDSSVAKGFELLLTRRSDQPWNGWLSYTWSRVEDREGGVETLRSWDQTSSVSGGITWATAGWQVTLAGTYHTGWPVTPVSLVDTGADPVVVVGPRNASRYADFASLDFRVSRDFALVRGTLNAYAEVTNALDRRNPCCTEFSYESEGGVTVLETETRHWLPLVPSIGVLWKF